MKKLKKKDRKICYKNWIEFTKELNLEQKHTKFDLKREDFLQLVFNEIKNADISSLNTDPLKILSYEISSELAVLNGVKDYIGSAFLTKDREKSNEKMFTALQYQNIIYTLLSCVLAVVFDKKKKSDDDPSFPEK